MGRDGQRRRSPRISALDGCKENHENRRLSRIKRKFNDSALTPVSKLAKQVWKGRDSSQSEDHSTHCVEWRTGRESQIVKENQKHDDHAITNGTASIMPAKHILELVLDTLQRRDTYEIFAEPVDPDEVEDYYEIIKEPMDFGTMRAKLHEGMYENLEQFEHDLFLIPENAMHFNSSATIYFRQARSIHELAKKVFHALKTNPENFVSEFSGMRRRSMRKALSDTKDSRFSTAKSGDVYSQGTSQCPSTSTFRRMSKKNPLMTDHFYARNFLTGSREGRLLSSEVSDRRTTYLYNKNSEDSTFYRSSNPLVLMNQGDISYKDSLMSYVKDLGPTAQTVANRKLGQHESNSCRTGSEKCQNLAATQRKSVGLDAKEFRTFRDFAPAGCNPFLKASDIIIDLTKDGEEENFRNRRKGKTHAANGTTGKEKTDILNSRTNNSTSFKDDNVRPVILALENYHSNVAEFKPRNKKSCILLTKNRPASDEAQQLKRQPLPLISQFTFDLPFLRARLNQMNAVEIRGKLRC